MLKDYSILINNLNTRAAIRRDAKDRKSVKEGKPDRLCELLEESSQAITELLDLTCKLQHDLLIHKIQADLDRSWHDS